MAHNIYIDIVVHIVVHFHLSLCMEGACVRASYCSPTILMLRVSFFFPVPSIYENRCMYVCMYIYIYIYIYIYKYVLTTQPSLV